MLNRNILPVILQGKLDVELEVLLEDKAKASPVGKGRDGPKSLPLPK